MSKFKTQMSTVQNRERGRGREGEEGRESEVRNLFAGLLLEANQRFGRVGS